MGKAKFGIAAARAVELVKQAQQLLAEDEMWRSANALEDALVRIEDEFGLIMPPGRIVLLANGSDSKGGCRNELDGFVRDVRAFERAVGDGSAKPNAVAGEGDASPKPKPAPQPDRMRP